MCYTVIMHATKLHNKWHRQDFVSGGAQARRREKTENNKCISYHPRYDIPTIYRYIVHRYTGTDIRYPGEYRYQPILTSMRPVCHSHTVYNNKMKLHES